MWLRLSYMCSDCLIQLVTRTDTRGWTPLHHAVAAGSTAIVNLLLRANADIDAQVTLLAKQILPRQSQHG